MSMQPRSRFRLSGGRAEAAHIAARDPFKLERRREERYAAEGMVSASYSNGVDRFGITHLELVDRSPRGLAARTRVRIEPGEIVTICPEGSTIPWVSAKAVRCEESDGEFVVGLNYCGNAAAA
jgi:hypothetical protein